MAKGDDPFSMVELLIGLPHARVLLVDRIGEVLEIQLDPRNPTDSASCAEWPAWPKTGRSIAIRTYLSVGSGECWCGTGTGRHARAVVISRGRRNVAISARRIHPR